jgi:hypothetical protein
VIMAARHFGGCFSIFLSIDFVPVFSIIYNLRLHSKLFSWVLGFQRYVELWRARWDLNPRSPAPEADTLIRARLRARNH